MPFKSESLYILKQNITEIQHIIKTLISVKYQGFKNDITVDYHSLEMYTLIFSPVKFGLFTVMDPQLSFTLGVFLKNVPCAMS